MCQHPVVREVVVFWGRLVCSQVSDLVCELSQAKRAWPYWYIVTRRRCAARHLYSEGKNTAAALPAQSHAFTLKRKITFHNVILLICTDTAERGESQSQHGCGQRGRDFTVMG